MIVLTYEIEIDQIFSTKFLYLESMVIISYIFFVFGAKVNEYHFI